VCVCVCVCVCSPVIPVGEGGSSSQTPPFVEEEAAISKQGKVLERTKIWPCFPTGSETKNDFAGEGQQKFAGLDCRVEDGDKDPSRS
jgi:hypothetical protein